MKLKQDDIIGYLRLKKKKEIKRFNNGMIFDQFCLAYDETTVDIDNTDTGHKNFFLFLFQLKVPPFDRGNSMIKILSKYGSSLPKAE